MKPKSPFIQSFDQLPKELPIYPINNVLLPGGEFPLELSSTNELALFQFALKHNQLLGLSLEKNPHGAPHKIGCAGRIRQYRERKDGRLNVMVTGICRFELREDPHISNDFLIAQVDWSNYSKDYINETLDPQLIEQFKHTLKLYFKKHAMQVNWDVLNKQAIEEVINNLVLVLTLPSKVKQQLLEATTVAKRAMLFINYLDSKSTPINIHTTPQGTLN